MTVPVFLTIPLHRPRLPDTLAAIELAEVDPHNVIAVVNGPNPPTPRDFPLGVTVAQDPSRFGGLNISRWWNVGLRFASLAAAGDHNTLVLNSDARITADNVARLAEAIDMTGVAAAYPSLHGRATRVNYRPEPVDLRTRLTGFCFMLRGDGVRADERFEWWYGDDDLDWQARVAGGSMMVEGVTAEHPDGGGTDLEAMADQIRTDRARFVAKWGRAPHDVGAVPGEPRTPYRG